MTVGRRIGAELQREWENGRVGVAEWRTGGVARAVGEMRREEGSNCNCSINTISSGRISSIGKITISVLVIFTQPAGSE